MSSISRVRGYLEAHPTPWRIVAVRGEQAQNHRMRQPDYCDEVREPVGDGPEVDAILDANGAVVLSSCRPLKTLSWFEGDVRALVDFVNLVGEEYEPQHGWPGLEGKPYDYGVKRGPVTAGQRQEIRDEYAGRFITAAEWFAQAGNPTEGEETWQPAANGYEVSTHGRARTPDGTILVPTRSMGGRNVYQLPDGVELIAPARKREWDKP